MCVALRLVRLFVAVNFPGEIKTDLSALQGKLKRATSDARWVREENFHLTIQFLGDTPVEQVPLVASALQHAATGIGPISLCFKGVGFFPDERKPRVLWLGVDGEVEMLAKLHRQVQKALEPLGFASEKRRFSPHLTLARFKSAHGLDDLIKATRQLENSSVGPVRIGSVDLMQSELGAGSPRYYVLAGVSLS